MKNKYCEGKKIPESILVHYQQVVRGTEARKERKYMETREKKRRKKGERD